ncbi:MAG: hypothetical protein Q7S59_05900 [Sulfurimonas sp.]|nr:hypothetical protein [Sulfurimonas sp.]
MQTNLLDLLKDGSVSSVLASVGKVAGVFHPAIGAGLMLASNLTDNMAQVDDKFLEDDVVGLEGSALRLDKMIANKSVDFDMLELISHNLKSISAFSQKTAKLMK